MRKNRSLTTVTGLVIPALKSLPIAALLLAGMTACSDDDMPGGNEAPDVSESTVTVGNDPAAQASRIIFYGTPGGRSTRAADFPDFPEVGKEPTVPSDLKIFKSFSDWNNYSGSYIIDGDNWGSNQITVSDVVYITGNISGIGSIGGKGTVYIMSSGSLGCNNQLQIGSEIIVKSYSDLQASYLQVDGTLLTNGNVTATDQLACSGTIVCNELVVDKHVQLNSGSKVKAKCIFFNNEGGEQSVNAAGVVAVRSYMQCADGLYMDGSSHIYLWPNAMVKVLGTLFIAPNSGGFFYHTSENKQKNALVWTNKLFVNGNSDNPEYLASMFSGILKLKYDELENCQPEWAEKFIPSATDYYIPKDDNGCNPGNGKEDEDKPFDPIAIIDGPTHSHNHLSATCIQPAPDGKRAYVSYHLNTEYKDNAQYDGENTEHQGCVELYNVSDNQAEISSWLMNDDFDFNHMIVDGDKAYTVGDTKKYGATLGVINLNGNGAFGKYELDAEGRENVMKYYSLYKKTAANRGSSGNCIIRDGNFFRIASYQGFQTMDATTLAIDNNAFLATNGSAKHIAKGGNYIVTLNLDQKGVESSTGTVNVYTTWGTPTATFKTEAITPIDGKNVIATDGTSIYVALGETGVAKYSMTGTLEGSYSWIEEKLESNPKYTGKPLANGLDVDDKYVYVANGAAGMLVLDKATMKRVARYAHSYKTVDNKSYYYSANYVRKVGNLIYIAYGRDGLEIVKMREDSK